MSLDKSIQSGKEKRKPYRKSKAFDYTCRNHGSCSYCESNRLYNARRIKEASDMELEEYTKEST